MYCLRCGREKSEKQVFCDTCLQDMARHPVRQDATVYIPSRKLEDPAKKSARRRKKPPTPEEIILSLQKRVKRLRIVIVILILLISAACAGIYYAWNHDPNFVIGQNYQTVETAGNSSVGTGG